MTGGDVHLIGDGTLTARVSRTGATLHRLTMDGADLLSAPAEVDPGLGHHGAVLAPWPNRIASGRYAFDGVRHQLPVNDHRFGHAMHGFVFDRPWAVTTHSASEIRLSTTIGEEPGYPFTVRLQVGYRVDDGELRCTATWENVGDAPAPFAIGFHPYLRLDGPLETWSFHLPAHTVMETDGSTKLPLDARPVTADADFARPAPIGDRAFSRAYGELARDHDGVATALVASSTRRLVLHLSAAFRWVQVFTADLPTPELRRAGFAVEPQTCPPNAFATGIDVIRLDPGECGEAWWSIRAEATACTR